MRIFTVCLASAAAAGILVLVHALQAEEEKLPLDKLPPAVVMTVKKRFPKGEMIEAAKETEDGKTVYEVTVKDNGQKIDATINPEGALLGLEKEIKRKDLPKAVVKSLDAKYPKADLKAIEEVIKVKDGKETLEYYEVHLVTTDKKAVEVKLEIDGKIKPEAK